MSSRLQQMLDDLEDVASLRLGRFAQAHEADLIATRVIQQGDVDVEDVIGIVEAWWTKTRPTNGNCPCASDIHTKLALLESIKFFARGGS